MSGQLRRGLQAAPSILRFVGNINADWFIHLWDQNQQKPNRFVEKYRCYPTTPEMLCGLESIYNPRLMRMSVGAEEMARLGLDHHDPALSQYAGIYLCDLMRRGWSSANGIVHDVVIRLRPDIIYPRDNILENWINLAASGPGNVLWTAVCTPGRVDDVIWAASPATMSLASDYCLDHSFCGDHTCDHGRLFHDHLAALGIEPREAPFPARSKLYAPMREETAWMDPIADFKTIYAHDIVMHYPDQDESDVEAMTPHEWVQRNRGWIDSL